MSNQKQIDAINSNPKLVGNISKMTALKLDPRFMLSILLHSRDSYLSMIHLGECVFYSLLKNNLLLSSQGVLRQMVVIFKTDEDERFSAVLSDEDFFGKVYKKKCFTNKEMETLFASNNIKGTIDSLEFPIPKNKNECDLIVKNWTTNPYTPYLCSIPESLIQGDQAINILQAKSLTPSDRHYYQDAVFKKNMIKKKVSFFHRSYLKNLCHNLSHEEKFCQSYTGSDIWNKIINGEYPNYFMSYKCAEFLEKKNMDSNHLRICASRLNNEPSLCSSKKIPGHLALFPRPDCKSVSTALQKANLKTDYYDCPADAANFSVTNIYRLSMHVENKKNKANTCSFAANLSFANMSLKQDKDAWPLKICYNDPVRKKEKCRPFIPGHGIDNPLAETRVIAEILVRTMAAPRKMICKMASKKGYNPHRLGARTGCLIVYDKDTCQAVGCPKTILYKNKVVSDITYRGLLRFDYFPNSHKNASKSANRLIVKNHKLESKAVKNLTELQFLLKQGRVAHGVGCMEDIFPVRFKKRTFNSCLPLPFIIDGLVSKNSNTLLVVRTALDDIHFPRLINWQFIYSSLIGYQKLHPLKYWMLHGFK